MGEITKVKKKTQNKGVLARARERLEARKQVVPSGVRIGFVIDATGSRDHNWAEAQSIQMRMFCALSETSQMALRLVHFGGIVLKDHGWEKNEKKIAKRMKNVRCKAGPTQVVESLELFATEEKEKQASSIILIGDAFEEKQDEVRIVAKALAAKGIKVFSFFEDNNYEPYGPEIVAEFKMMSEVFEGIAEITGGKFARFGEDLPLADLCEGVALLAAGGEKAVDQIKNENVRRLLLSGPSRQ